MGEGVQYVAFEGRSLIFTLRLLSQWERIKVRGTYCNITTQPSPFLIAAMQRLRISRDRETCSWA